VALGATAYHHRLEERVLQVLQCQSDQRAGTKVESENEHEGGWVQALAC